MLRRHCYSPRAERTRDRGAGIRRCDWHCGSGCGCGFGGDGTDGNDGCSCGLCPCPCGEKISVTTRQTQNANETLFLPWGLLTLPRLLPCGISSCGGRVGAPGRARSLRRSPTGDDGDGGSGSGVEKATVISTGTWTWTSIAILTSPGTVIGISIAAGTPPGDSQGPHCRRMLDCREKHGLA